MSFSPLKQTFSSARMVIIGSTLVGLAFASQAYGQQWAEGRDLIASAITTPISQNNADETVSNQPRVEVGAQIGLRNNGEDFEYELRTTVDAVPGEWITVAESGSDENEAGASYALKLMLEPRGDGDLVHLHQTVTIDGVVDETTIAIQGVRGERHRYEDEGDGRSVKFQTKVRSRR